MMSRRTREVKDAEMNVDKWNQHVKGIVMKSSRTFFCFVHCENRDL
jgi:hypothetical protein